MSEEEKPKKKGIEGFDDVINTLNAASGIAMLGIEGSKKILDHSSLKHEELRRVQERIRFIKR